MNSGLVTGLAGGFIPPGPSGAPTRGRLDTCRQERNFFSVDNERFIACGVQLVRNPPRR